MTKKNYQDEEEYQKAFNDLPIDKKEKIERLPNNNRSEWDAIFWRIIRLQKMKLKFEIKMFDESTDAEKLATIYASNKQAESDISNAWVEANKILNCRPINAIAEAIEIADSITKQGVTIRPKPGDYSALKSKERFHKQTN